MKPAIVVTGAASGIGREIAGIAARDGCFMMLVDRAREPLENFAAELARSGVQTQALSIDFADPGAGDVIERALSERGLFCEVLVNSAGLGLFGPAAEVDRAEQMGVVSINVCALMELTLRFLPGMVARGRGGILNLGSIAAYAPGPNMAIYHASKAFVRMFSAALAREVAGTGVTVTCLSPGVVRTAFLDRLPIGHSRFYKLMPRSNAATAAEVEWRGFRAGRRVVVPRWIDRLIIMFALLLPARLIPQIPSAQKFQRQ
jgi:hypothetical protein